MYGHQEPVMWAKVLEKNNQVLSLDKNGVLKKWTIGLPCVMELNKDAALDDPNETAAFDRSEKYILTNGKCTRPRLWTVSGLLLKEFAEGTAACFSPNQQAVVTAENNNLLLWQFADMKPVARSFAQPIRWFAAAADAQHILVTTTNGDLHIFNPVTQTVNTLKHTFSPIDSAMLSPDGKYLIDFERNKTILRDGQTLRVIYELSQSPVLIAKFSFDKNDKNNMCVLTVSQVDNQGKVEMMVYRIATQEKMLQCSTINLFNDFAEYNFAAGSEYLLYPNEGKMYKHDLLRTKSCEQDHGYKAITYTPQNKRWIWLQQGGYLAAGLDGYPDLRSRAATYKLYNDETRASKIEVSADGQYWIMVANSSSKINIRTICNKRLQMVTTLDLYCRNSGEQPLDNHCRPKRAHTAVFSPSGKYILTLAPNGAVKLWHFDRATVEKMMADVVG